MKKLTPLKAIRKWCLECVGYSPKEVRECTGNERDTPCPLYPYRMGKRPGGVSPLKGKGIPKSLLAYQNKKSVVIQRGKTPRTHEKPKVEELPIKEETNH